MEIEFSGEAAAGLGNNLEQEVEEIKTNYAKAGVVITNIECFNILQKEPTFLVFDFHAKADVNKPTMKEAIYLLEGFECSLKPVNYPDELDEIVGEIKVEKLIPVKYTSYSEFVDEFEKIKDGHTIKDKGIWQKGRDYYTAESWIFELAPENKCQSNGDPLSVVMIFKRDGVWCVEREYNLDELQMAIYGETDFSDFAEQIT